MNEAVIFQSPHAIKPEVFLTEAEREERYRTRLDETFCPYTVMDVLTRVSIAHRIWRGLHDFEDLKRSFKAFGKLKETLFK